MLEGCAVELRSYATFAAARMGTERSRISAAVTPADSLDQCREPDAGGPAREPLKQGPPCSS